MRSIVLVCLVVLAASSLSAQALPAPAPGEIPDTPHWWRQLEAQSKTIAAARKQEAPVRLSVDQELYDVHFYDLALDLDPDQQLLTGTVTMRATVTGAVLRIVDLDLHSGLTVTGVRAGGDPAAWEHVLNVLSVDLGSDHTMGQEIEVAVDYHGNPATLGSAFGWTAMDTRPLVWTLSEPYGARTWWPCKDLNHDKADSVDLHVSVPFGMVVASNGTLVDEETAGDRTIFHWQERYPICTYLVSVTAHPYEVVTDTYVAQDGTQMPVVHYVAQNYVEDATAGYAVTVPMIEAFVEGFGEYPFLDEKYGHAGFTWGGGMEHQTCSSMLFWWYGEGLISHELAHQWWGDLVTCKSFHHIWLNEGFATWSEAYWLEQSQGVQAYRDEMNLNRYTGHGTIYVEDPDDFGSIFDIDLSYNKASWVVHMLRGVLGDEDFFAGLALYRERFAYDAADTEDFRAVMEEVSGRDLEVFFQQWIYDQYYPRYSVGVVLTPQDGNTLVQVRIEQTQNSGPEVFVMPIQLRFATDQGDHDVTVENERRVQHYAIEVPGTVFYWVFDPEDWILCDAFSGGTVDVAPDAAPFTLSAYPNPFNPRTTLRLELGESGPVRLALHDAAGRLVRVLVGSELAAGIHEVAWDGRDGRGRPVAAGVYFAVAEQAGRRQTTRLALVR